MEDQDTTQSAADQAATDQDNGTTEKRKGTFSVPFLKAIKANPYLSPHDIVVAGDHSTAHGAALSGTFLDDGRQNLPWGAEHEKILFGLLTGSDVIKTKQIATDENGNPIMDGDTPQTITVEAMVTRGQPELIYLQGSDDDWYPLMEDGRQRRRAAIELDRRLGWIVAVLNACGEAVVKSKPARRNLLIKIGNLHRGKGDTKGKTWAETCADLNIPAGTPAYTSPEVGVGDEPASLLWLSETFAKMIVGSDDLGESTKRGWLTTVKSDGEIVKLSHYPVWMKISVSAVNVDVNDPRSLLESVAAKEAQVPTPPSLLADQIGRLLDARENPSDPTSKPLYTRTAVRDRFGMVDSTLQNYEMLRSMCPEVKALIDSDRMSMTVALGKRESAFIKWPARGEREPLPFDLQRLILAHLVDAFDAADEDGEKVKLVGPKVMSVGKALRDKAIAGKLRPLGEDDDETPIAPRPNTGKPADATQGAPNAQDATPEKKARSKSIVDVASFREHTSRAIASLALPADDADEITKSSFVAKSDRLSLVKALGLVFTGAEPITALDAWPDVKEIVVASLPAKAEKKAPAATAAEPSEEMLILDWISAATEAAAISGADVPNVTVETDSHGRKPTQAQADAANAKIAEWKTAFAADQSATSLDTFIMERIVAGQRTAA